MRNRIFTQTFSRIFVKGRGCPVAWLLIIFIGAWANQVSAAEEHLRVGIFEMKPLAFVDEKGQAQGLFVELFDTIALQEGWSVEYIPGGLNESFERLEQGEIDLLLPVGFSEKRAKKFDFPEQFVYLDWGAIIRAPGKKIDTLLDLQGVEIAAVKGSIIGVELTEYLAQFHVNARLVELDDYHQVFSAVSTGKYPAGVCISTPGQMLAKEFDVERTSILFSPLHVTYATNKGRHPQILSAINRHLTKMKGNPKSLYFQLLGKWLPQQHIHSKKYVYLSITLLVGLLSLVWLALSLRRQVKHKINELTTVNDELNGSREELRRLNLQFQTLLDGIPDHLMLVSPEMKVIWMNRAARRFSGAHDDEPAALNCYRQWSQTAGPCDDCPVQACFTSGMAQETVMRSGGRVFGIKAFPITNEQGQVESVIKLAIDITEKFKRRENDDRKNRLTAVGELSAGVAHEINNPAGLILSNLSTICEVFEDIAPILDEHYSTRGDFCFGGLQFSRMREQLPSMLKETNEAARRIRQIVDDLKDFSRGGGPRDVAEFHLNEAIQRSIRLTDLLLRKATRHFTIDLAAEPVVVYGCIRRVEQVLVNLLANACQALPDQDCAITLTTRYSIDRREVEIVICDQGVGIPPEHLPKLATPFFSTRHGKGGTGLGLSVSFGIIKEHGGTIHFASEPGKGTIVTITLPASISEVTA